MQVRYKIVYKNVKKKIKDITILIKAATILTKHESTEKMVEIEIHSLKLLFFFQIKILKRNLGIH